MEAVVSESGGCLENVVGVGVDKGLYILEILDIGSDLFWLTTTACYSQKENYKGKQAICVVASILWVVKVLRFISSSLGKYRLRAAIKRGDIEEKVLDARKVMYVSRAYLLEELPSIAMVVYVAKQLGEFDAAAIASMVISIVMLLGNLGYAAYKT